MPDMWQRITRPDVLIFLDVSYAATRSRRPYIDGGTARLSEQHRRLSHARQNCDFYLETSDLTPDQVRQAVLDFISAWQEARQASL